MAIQTTHVIKKDSVAASSAKRPNPALLGSSIRIPKDCVNLRRDESDDEATLGFGDLLRHDRASISENPIEVVTRPIEPNGGARKKDGGDEEDDREPTAEEVEAAWETRLEEEVEKARKDGYEAGMSAAREELENEVKTSVARLADELHSVQSAWEAYLRDAGVRLVELTFRLADTVLDAPLPEDVRRVSETAIADAVERMADGLPVEVTVHPVSYLRLQESGLEDQLNAVHSKLRWRADANLKENEWVVQSDRSAIRRLESELLDHLRRDLALRDVHRDESAE